MAEFKQVDAASFDQAVLQSPRPVLVDFYADWCGPCRAMEPALKDIAKEYEDEISIVKLNVDADPLVQERYGVQGIPALLFFDGGEVKERIIGAAPRSTIAAAVERLANAHK